MLRTKTCRSLRFIEEAAARERATDRVGMVLGVPTVPHNRMRNAGGLEFRLRRPVLDAQAHWRNVRVEETRVDHALHFGRFRGLDHIVVLRGPLANFARRDESSTSTPASADFRVAGLA